MNCLNISPYFKIVRLFITYFKVYNRRLEFLIDCLKEREREKKKPKKTFE